MSLWVQRPTIPIDWDRPLAERFAAVPPEALEASVRLLDAVRAEIPPRARPLATAMRLRTANRFHREAVTLAEQVGADWRDIMLANVSYDLVLMTLCCSTIALPSGDGPVLARNMDWWPEDLLARASYLLRHHRRGKLHFANAGWPGAIGVVTALSGRGFAVALNAVPNLNGPARTGYPVLLHLRRVVEDARDFTHAVRMLSRTRLFSSALFTVVGLENDQRVVIERGPTRCAQRWGEGDEPLLATNDYRALARPKELPGTELLDTTCHRYQALCEIFAGHRAGRSVSDEELLYALTDPRVIQTITAQHILLRPRQGQVRLFVPQRLLAGAQRAHTTGQR